MKRIVASLFVVAIIISLLVSGTSCTLTIARAVYFTATPSPKSISTLKPTSTPTQNATTNAAAPEVAAYCMGDSITYGVGCEVSSYENTLHTLLKASYPNDTWTLYNEGVGGETTAQMLARFYTGVTSHPDCKYVLIWGGINDIMGGANVSLIESNLQSMYSLAHAAKIKVVALYLTPTSWCTPTMEVKLKTINSWIQSTAQYIDFRLDVYTLLEDPDLPPVLVSPAIRAQPLFQHTPWEPYRAMSCVA